MIRVKEKHKLCLTRQHSKQPKAPFKFWLNRLDKSIDRKYMRLITNKSPRNMLYFIAIVISVIGVDKIL